MKKVEICNYWSCTCFARVLFGILPDVKSLLSQRNKFAQKIFMTQKQSACSLRNFLLLVKATKKNLKYRLILLAKHLVTINKFKTYIESLPVTSTTSQVFSILGNSTSLMGDRLLAAWSKKIRYVRFKKWFQCRIFHFGKNIRKVFQRWGNGWVNSAYWYFTCLQ